MDYKFDSLILLEGTNPLPNYVVATYFLKNNPALTHIFIVYSEERKTQKGTLTYAENLKEVIQRSYTNVEIHLIPIEDVTRGKVIEKNITDKLYELSPSKKFHLNYTGGTKAMGIHAYRTIQGYCSKVRCSDCSFSYLDARSFKLVGDEEGPVSDDLRREIIISLEDLLFLHGLKRIDQKSDFEFSDTLKIFEDLINQDSLKEIFSSYRRENFLNNNKLIRKKSEITNAFRQMKLTQPLLSILLSMPQEYQFFDQDGNFKEPVSNKALEKAIKFIDGTWLEYYVFKTLSEGFKDYEINQNLVIRDLNWPPGQRFEIDVALMNGYQLIGISCTTSDEISHCKNKGFEVLLRVRQMGGDEARAVLITRLEGAQKDNLNEELKIDTGGKDNILVLGEEDLKKDILLRKILDFIS